MTLKEFDLLIQARDITSVIITPAPLVPSKWNAHFKRKTGELVALTARRENIRNFASIDSAVDAVSSIGVQKVTVDWSGCP